MIDGARDSGNFKENTVMEASVEVAPGRGSTSNSGTRTMWVFVT